MNSLCQILKGLCASLEEGSVLIGVGRTLFYVYLVKEWGHGRKLTTQWRVWMKILRNMPSFGHNSGTELSLVPFYLDEYFFDLTKKVDGISELRSWWYRCAPIITRQRCNTALIVIEIDPNPPPICTKIVGKFCLRCPVSIQEFINSLLVIYIIAAWSVKSKILENRQTKKKQTNYSTYCIVYSR